MGKLPVSVLISACAGLLAALPLVLTFHVVPNGIDENVSWIAVAAVVLCPPWELFWAVMGLPKGASVTGISIQVLCWNALIYAPLGLLSTAMANHNAAKRGIALGAALTSLLLVGHCFFMLGLA